VTWSTGPGGGTRKTFRNELAMAEALEVETRRVEGLQEARREEVLAERRRRKEKAQMAREEKEREGEGRPG